MPKPTDTVERRAIAPFELQMDENMVRVVGHAAVFNQEADIGGQFREVIHPGAFTRAIQESDVPFLIEHSDLPLARNTSGTLHLSEDSIGLRIEAELDMSDPDVQRIVPKMKRGDLDKMSFAFRAKEQKWVEGENEDDVLRVLTDVELYDVSIVTSPAYGGTDIALRSLKAKRDDERDEVEDRNTNSNAAVRRKMIMRLKRRSEIWQRQATLDRGQRRVGA